MQVGQKQLPLLVDNASPVFVLSLITTTSRDFERDRSVAVPEGSRDLVSREIFSFAG